MEAVLSALNSFFSGPVMVWGVAAIGLILTCKTRFVQFTKLGYTLRYTFSKMFQKPEKGQGGITPFQAVTTALSGTLGTGNIAGVAAAVSIGGAGAIFWMWVSAFFGMATKYSEIVLAVKYRERRPDGSFAGGPMYYLEHATGGRKLAVLFAAVCLVSSFFMGNMVQSNTAAMALRAVFDIRPGLLRLIFAGIAVLVGFVIIGGIKRIARVTEALVPAMALFYIGGCAVVICMNWRALPDAVGEIFRSAFALKSAVGGIAGYGMAQAIRVGFTRGVFTNEAGLGSAPIAHAAAENPSPAKQGLWGIFEVFFDTIVMCTLTGVVIVLSGVHRSGSSDGAALTLQAFDRYLGGFASLLIGISTAFFAVATIIGWSYYGESCVKYLCRSNTALFGYKLCYVCAVYLGAVAAIDMVWGLADLFNSLMMVPNLIGVVLLSDTVKGETARFRREVRRERKARSSGIRRNTDHKRE